MTRRSATISTTALEHPGLDYAALNAEGTALTQQLSGDIWTDYNFSDPGVTILEQLCYALTELSYRAGFSVTDLLCDPDTGQIRLRRQGLYPAPAIMPVNPVTIADLRRLVLDRVAAISNVWFTPCQPDRVGGVNGLYDIAIHVPALADPCCTHITHQPEHIIRRVRDCYTAHRALDEDVNSINILSLIGTRVAARVQMGDHVDASLLQARLLFTIGLFLAPEPRRTTLATQLAAGKTTAEIFDGPLMLRGFINDDQLTPLPTAIPVDSLLRLMAETTGVVSVEGLTVTVSGDCHSYIAGETIPVPAGSLLWLDTAADANGSFPIQLYRGDVACQPNPKRVAVLLAGLWTAQRRTYALRPEYEEAYAPPTGKPQDLSAYYSVQNQFPNVYGINAYGLPEQASPARNGQARQLKGYLMPFDQLMADYFSQLAFLRDLFSVRTGGGSTTYATQSLRPIVPDVEPLLSPDYEAGLASVTAASDPVAERRAAILDLLLSLYGESLAAPPQSGCDCGNGDDADDPPLVRAKQALLLRMVPATRDRGRGFDYRRPALWRNQAGMLIRCRIQLGILDRTAAGSGSSGAIAVTDPAEATIGQSLDGERAAVVERYFLPVDRVMDSGDNDDGEEETDRATAPLAGQRVPAPLLPALADPERYRIGILPGERSVRVACRGNDGGWWLLGSHPRTEDAIASVRDLLRANGGQAIRRQLYVVEHVLLRAAAPLSGTPGSRYSFRLSAIIATSRKEAADIVWQRQVTAIVRENTPSHIAPQCLFLDRAAMRRFRTRYDAWMDALRRGPPDRLAEASLRLERFLADHSASPDANPATSRPPHA